MSAFDTRPDSLAGDSATLESQRLWKAAGKQDLDFASQRLRNRLQSKMFGIDAAPIKIGRYAVLETLGSGGMGVVYAAYDDQLDRKVAVKLLRNPGDDDESSVGRGRLLREAQALAKLSHPNVVQVYEASVFDGRVFIAMEFLPGPDLRSWLQEGRHDWREVLRCYGQAGRGLAAAHRQGVIHRDFKPANLLFGADGQVRVVDFGLARAERVPERSRLSAAGEVAEGQKSGAFEVELTQTGELMGTPAYMSPEQARHEPVDARSDQYSFCVALYEALFGRRPHEGRNTAEVLMAISEGEVVPPPRGVKVPARAVRAIMRGLSADPKKRFASVEALLLELEPRRRGGLHWFGGAGVVLGAGALFAMSAEPPCPSFEDVMEETWNNARSDELQASFARSSSFGAEATAGAVSERLDRYADQWIDARRDTCEAHLVRKEESSDTHDKRVACLTQSKAEFTALVDGLATADDTAVGLARDAAAELPSVEECSGAQLLGASPPETEEVRVLRTRLATASAQYKMGRYPQAIAMIDDVIHDAQQRDAVAVEAQAYLRRADAQRRQKANLAAAEDYGTAAALAEEAGDDRLVVRALIGQADRQAKIDRIDAASSAVDWAERKLRRIGFTQESSLGLGVLEARALVAWNAGDSKKASELQRVVVAGRERSAEYEDEPHLLRALSALAGMLDDAGQHDAAREIDDDLHARLLRSYGPQHPRVADNRFNVAVSYLNAQQFDLAAERALEAEAIYLETLGPRSPVLFPVNKILIAVALANGDHDSAHKRAEVLAELGAMDGVSPGYRLDALGILAQVAQLQGQHAEAAAHYDAYLLAFRQTPDPGHASKVFVARIAYAEQLLSAGEPDADVAARDALRHLEGHDEPEHRRLRGSANRVIAEQARRSGDTALAGETLAAALMPWDERPPTTDGERGEQARLRWLLAQVLPRADRARARALADQAEAVLREVEPEAEELAAIAAWRDGGTPTG